MNIILLLVANNIGGVEKRFYTYSRYVLKRTDNNYTVVVSNSLWNILGDLSVAPNNRVIRYGIDSNVNNKFIRYLNYLLLFMRLLPLIVKRFDASHCITVAALKFRHVIRAKKHIYSYVGSISQHQIRNCKSKAYKTIITEGVKIDCLDRNIKKMFIDFFPAQSNNFYTTPCSFINYDVITNDVEKENLISYAGRLEDFKGIQLLICIIPQILEQTNFKISILGTGSYADEIKDLIRQHRAFDRVTLGFTVDPKEVLKKSKIFLSLQKEENYPSQSLLEAMYCENSIIATDVGLTREIVKEEFGRLVKSSDDLLEAIIELASLDSELSVMGEKAKDFVVNNHAIEKFHKYLIGIYSDTN